jgi:hypothetical protein
MALLPVIILALSGGLAACSLILSWMRNRIARATAQIALLLAALVVPCGIVYDWFFVWDTGVESQSKATAIGLLFSHATSYGAAALVPAMLAALAWKRSASNLKRGF